MMHYEEEYDLVLFPQTFYPDVDATAKLMTDLAEFLVKKGKKVLIVTPNRSFERPNLRYPEFEIIDDIHVHRIKVPKLDKNNALQKILLFYLFSTKAKRFLKKLNYKVAMAILPPFFVAYKTLKVTKKKGKKFIFLLHDLYPDSLVKWKRVSPNNPLVILLKKYNNYIFRNSDKTIFVGRDQIEYVKENYGVSNEKIEFIPNWAKDLKESFIKNDSIKEKYYKPGFNVLYAGNIGEAQVKSLEKVIKLMKNEKLVANSINLILVGQGRRKDYLINMAKETSNVYFFDYVYDFSDYQNLIYFSDCCLVSMRDESKGMSVPSKTYYYLSGGKPILADVPVNSEVDILLRENNVGINITKLNEEEAIENILMLKNNKEYYKELSKNARKAFEDKYSKEVALESYLRVVENLL
ncbi:Glycosyltransferase-like protein [Petrotoga mobilis SJ95]|uniref:Glycosyltransferase-like protein n=1 Tax=Petrotoga mobilis (strain DSM 10674 / SJ95) TaxID=403833 RepID=A9BGE5_PETMO|nr:glycosyltransferase family 4 protein [Petrotoga mobilis]ABX31995.1 Glycosyltransferase-like protein [Petrotoga mobilis SJ95]